MDWLDIIKKSFETEESIKRYISERHKFATEVYDALNLNLSIDDDSPELPIIYGVSISCDTKPIYIGQSTKYPRRIYDLPIGESHHLGKTFPLELWSKIIVLKWSYVIHYSKLLRLCEELKGKKEFVGYNADKLISSINQGLETLFQEEFKPIFNMITKSRGGSVSFGTIRKSKATPFVKEIFEEIKPFWIDIQSKSDSLPANEPFYKGDFGCVVFPNRMWNEKLELLEGKL